MPRNRKTILAYNLMMLPGIVILLIFAVYPALFGSLIVFEQFVPAKGIWGSKWVGLYYFDYIFQIPDARRVFANTVIIAVGKIIAGLICPVSFALLLNEVRCSSFKRVSQTLVYLPHFLSWVILGGVVKDVLGLDGIINNGLAAMGMERIYFLSRADLFRPILIVTNVWKEFGWGTIIYLAALSHIDPSLYEAAVMDGAGRFRQMLSVTLPGISSTIILMTTLSLGRVLNAGFDQVFNLSNPLVYSTGDIVDTYVYRVGLQSMQYSLATAVDLIKSIIGMALIMLSNFLANRFAGYRIF